MKKRRYGSLRRVFPLVCAAVIVSAVVACGSEATTPPIVPPTPAPPPSPTLPAAAPSPQPVATSTPEPKSTSTPIPYNSVRAMYKVFPGFGRTSSSTFDALEEVKANDDKSMVPVLVESMRYQSTANVRQATADVLQSLTDDGYGGEDWKGWMEWLGKHRDEYPPPDEYLDWKLNFMSELHPRFFHFLLPATKGAITVDPTEIVWGGVLPDGIPDIRDPKMLTPEEADFLDDDERVFGVSINGDTRAYPLRIINGHEMVNDTVGGEPVSLAW